MRLSWTTLYNGMASTGVQECEETSNKNLFGYHTCEPEGIVEFKHLKRILMRLIFQGFVYGTQE